MAFMLLLFQYKTLLHNVYKLFIYSVSRISMDLSEKEKFDSSQDEEDPNQLRLLYATFKGHKKRQRIKLIHSRIVFNNYWRLDQTQFTQLWDKAFEKMIEAKFSYLNLMDLHEQYSIPKSITLPVYSQLKYFQIQISPIKSIQRLAFIDFNKLYSLTLSSTYVDKLKSLNKLNIPSLQIVKFVSNKVSEFCFERMNYSTQWLTIDLQHFEKFLNFENDIIEGQQFGNREIKTEPQNILWDSCKLVKIQNFQSQLKIRNMIRQPKVLRKLLEHRKTNFCQYNQQTNKWQDRY